MLAPAAVRSALRPLIRLLAPIASVAIVTPAAPQSLRAQTPGVPSTVVTCPEYGPGRPVPDTVSSSAAAAVASCIDVLRGGLLVITASTDSVRVPYGGSPPDSATRPVDDYLVAAHREYKSLKQWIERPSPIDEDRAARYRASLDALAVRLHGLMDERGLRRPFSAALLSGPVFSLPGTTDRAEGQAGTDVTALAHIGWESRHFWADGKADASLEGSIGFEPTMLLARADGGEVDSVTLATFDNAFVWHLGVSLNVHTEADPGEFSLTLRTGQTLLISETSVGSRDGRDFLAVPVDNGVNRYAWFFEGAIEYNRFTRSLDQLHDLQGFLSPIFHLSAGLKYDGRFAGDGQLSDFERPGGRYFFRFLIDALNVRDERRGASDGSSFTFGFGVEYDGGLGGDVPSETRLIFRGDIDLLNALRNEG